MFNFVNKDQKTYLRVGIRALCIRIWWPQKVSENRARRLQPHPQKILPLQANVCLFRKNKHCTRNRANNSEQHSSDAQLSRAREKQAVGEQGEDRDARAQSKHARHQRHHTSSVVSCLVFDFLQKQPQIFSKDDTQTIVLQSRVCFLLL